MAKLLIMMIGTPELPDMHIALAVLPSAAGHGDRVYTASIAGHKH